MASIEVITILATIKRLFVSQRLESTGIFESAQLDGIAKWSTGAFAFVGATATFFGIKDGVLDSLLRTNPVPALWILVLVGGGVVIGVLAPVFKKTDFAPAIWVPISVVLFAVVTLILVPDVLAPPGAQGKKTNFGVAPFWTIDIPTEFVTGGLVVASAVALLLAIVLSIKAWMPLGVASLIIAVAMIGFGLYGAAKLSILSKALPDRPQISVTQKDGTGGQILDAHVVVGRQDDKKFLLQVVGVQAARDDLSMVKSDDKVLASYSLAPDATGRIDSTQSVAVQSGSWASLSIRFCEAIDQNTRCDASKEAASVPGRLDSKPPTLAAQIKPGVSGGSYDMSVSAAGLLAGKYASVEIRRDRGGRNDLLATATLRGDANGMSTWSPTIAGSVKGDTLIIKSAACADVDKSDCAATLRDLARLVVS